MALDKLLDVKREQFMAQSSGLECRDPMLPASSLLRVEGRAGPELAYSQQSSGKGEQMNQWLQLFHGVEHVVQVTEKHQYKQLLLV